MAFIFQQFHVYSTIFLNNQTWNDVNDEIEKLNDNIWIKLKDNDNFKITVKFSLMRQVHLWKRNEYNFHKFITHYVN